MGIYVKFSNGDQLQGIMFRKNRDYYLTSMSCFIQLTNDISKLTHYHEIKKIADLSNSILKNGIDHTYIGRDLEVFFDLGKLSFEEDKSNRALSVDAVEFFDYLMKQKRFVLIYSPYKELENFGIKFKGEKKDSSINSYSVKLLKEKGKTYLEKEIFFDNQKLLDQIEEEYDRKNVIFFKFNSVIYAFKFNITAAYFNSKNFWERTKKIFKNSYTMFFFRQNHQNGISILSKVIRIT